MSQETAKKVLTASDITNALLKHFRVDKGYKYQLCNCYVFAWESDFFCISRSGISYEVEVKVSRSDFFADFNKKEKYRLLNAEKPFTIKEYEQYNGWIFDEEGKKRWFSYKECGWGKRPIRTSFRFAFPDGGRPNKFLYAVPEGLIDKNEVPEYAGLIYVNERIVPTIVKRPKALHKKKNDFTEILLDKYYYAYLRMMKSEQNGSKFKLEEEL